MRLERLQNVPDNQTYLQMHVWTWLYV